MPQLDYCKGFLIVCPTTSIHSFILFRTIASKHKCGGVTSLLSVPCPSLKPFKGSKSQIPSLGPQGPARTGSLLSLDAPGLLTLHALGTLASFRSMEHSHLPVLTSLSDAGSLLISSFACLNLTLLSSRFLRKTPWTSLTRLIICSYSTMLFSTSVFLASL